MPNDARNALATTFLLSVLALGWWFFYAKPHQDFLLAVAACTGDDTSRAAWDACVDQVQNQED